MTTRIQARLMTDRRRASFGERLIHAASPRFPAGKATGRLWQGFRRQGLAIDGEKLKPAMEPMQLPQLRLGEKIDYA